MNQQIRFLTFVAVSVALLYGWQTFFAPPPVPRTPPGAVAEKTEPQPSVPAPAPAPSLEAPSENAVPEPELRTVEVQNGELWKARFTTRGAALVSFELLGTKQTTRPDKEGARHPVDLVHPDEKQLAPLSAEIVLPSGTIPPNALWELSEEKNALVFTRQQGDVKATKRISWNEGSYELNLEVKLSGPSLPAEVPVSLSLQSWKKPEGSTGFMGMGATADLHQAVCRTSEEIERLGWDSGETLTVPGTTTFAGLDEKYFVSVIAPEPGQKAVCTIAGPRPGALETLVSAQALPVEGESVARFDLYFGPKDVELLKAAGHGLDETIDFGFFAIIARPLLALLRLFESFAGNWGIAIVLLTLLVKLITFPLTHRQMKSMEEMRRLAPKIEDLKKKYAGDQARVNVEMMQLYKEHKVQPLGGCLPMLVQMPVWFALYQMLSMSFELYNEPFVAGWITDLTAKDPYYVLPILMTVTMVLTQILTPQTAQNQQMKYMMYGMPVFFGLIMLTLPAGLVLYIFTNNVLSIAQSLWFRKSFGHPEVKPA